MSKLYTPNGYFKRCVDLSSFYRVARVKRDGTPDVYTPVYRADACSSLAWAEKRRAELERMNPTERFVIIEPARGLNNAAQG